MDRLEELRVRFDSEPCFKNKPIQLIHIEKGSAKIQMLVTEEIVVLEGFSNGGFVCALANSAGVYAAMAQIPAGHTRLLDIIMQFEAPSRLNETIIGIAKVQNESRQYIWVEARVEGMDGKCKAFGILKYNKPKE